MEKDKIALATLCVLFSIYIKLFGIVALILFLFYPNKIKTALYCLLWALVLFCLPLIVVSFNELLGLYNNWSITLKHDESISWGLSIMGIIKACTGADISKTLIQGIGAILLCIPILFHRNKTDLKYRLLYLSSILIWIVTFNHKAESPSFIIALTGVAIWFTFIKPSTVNISLILLAVIFTSLAHSDIFPASFRHNFIDVYCIKGVPSFLAWLAIQYNIYVMAFKPQPAQAASSIGE